VAGARVAAASESSAVRFVTGLLAAVACGVLALHAVVKRHPRARNWLENALPAARSARGVERFVSFHSRTGALALALVLAHAGLSVPRGTAGALLLCFWFVAATGVAGAVLYRVLPRRLARLERRGSLPEDRADEREALRQALFAGLSAQNEAVKELARRVLVPYSKAAGGALALVLSGRSLAAEEAVLSARIRALLGGRKSERLAEVGPLVGVAVAVRALGARRLLEAALRAWLPLHALGVVALLALLALHVAGVLR
jgi:hypothetical protein